MKIIGLLVSLLIVAYVLYLVLGKPSPTSTDAPKQMTTLGAAPPKEFGKNYKATKDHTERQTCLANCASEERTCRAVALEEPAAEACTKAKSACDLRCP